MTIIPFSNITYGTLNFSNVSVSETDTGPTGSYDAFSDSTGMAFLATDVPYQLPAPYANPYQGLLWQGFAVDALQPGASVSLTFNYDVHETSSSLGINGLQLAFTPDLQNGSGISLTAVEYVYADAARTQLVGQTSIDLSQTSSTAPYAPTDFALSAAFQNLYVTVQVDASVASGAPADSAVGFSIIDQGFHQASLAGQAGLGDTVWYDANKDGIQDNGETGVSGVSVTLLDASGNPTGLTAITNASGYYSFTNINVGTYQVQFGQPLGYSFTTPGLGGNPETDSNADQTTGTTGLITLTAGEFDDSIDAGLVTQGSNITATAALGDYVFEDMNANGIQDAGDTGIAGVTVNLLDANGVQIPGETTITDSTGHYAFTSLLAGTYEVSFTAPANYTFSPSGASTPNNPDTDSNPDHFAGSVGTTDQIILPDGTTDNSIDAGMYRPAALGDYVFSDLNGNGIQDSGDTGVSGVTVNLLDSEGNSAGQTATTNASGYYSFSNLRPGVYEVQFVAPTGATFSPMTQGSNRAIDSNPNATSGITTGVTLVSGQGDNTIDAGLILPTPTPPPGTAQLGDRVWYDCNANGIQNYGETGVANVTVNLLMADGVTVLASTTTDSNGLYLFSSLNAGTYEVQFVAPTGKSFTAALQGSNRAIDSNPDTTTGVTGPIVLAAGGIDLTIDAGLVNTPNTAKLGDWVFQDCNGNGIQDAGESGVSCVTVKLLSSSGSVLRTTTTDSSGHYLFSNLAAGTYTVQFVAPSGMKFTTALQGGNTALDSNPNAAGTTASITLAAGQTDLSIDAGLYKPASLGNVVFCDANGNGVMDWCESGVSGVTVKLLNSTGTSVLGTTTTDSSGHYGFSNLIPGVYEVQFVAPTGQSFTTQMVGSNTSIDSNPNATTGITGPITLTCGECDNTIDAGLIKTPNTAKLGDFVFCDANHNGIQDAGEKGIGGVTVKLLNSSGNSTLATTTTNSSGLYQFGGLAAGSYVVQFVTPGSYTISPSLRGTDTSKDSNASTSTGKTGVITLTAGQTDLTIDAGMYQSGSSCGGGNSGGNGCGGWTYYNNSGNCGGGGYSGGSQNCGYGSSNNGCAPGSSSGGGQYSGGGNWGCSGWNGSGWTDTSGSGCGLGELQSVCGNAQQVEFTYHHCDTVNRDALSCGIGSSSGHNGLSPCFIQITDKSGDHSWGANTYYQGSISDGCKIETSGDLTNCGGQLYAHIYASQADCNAGRNAIQDIAFNCSGSKNIYLGQQVGSLCLTGYSGTQGSAYTNW